MLKIKDGIEKNQRNAVGSQFCLWCRHSLTAVTAEWKALCKHASLTLKYEHFLQLWSNCRCSFAIRKISALKSIPGFTSGRVKSPGREDGGGKNGNLWFCGIFSNIGSRLGLFFGFSCVQGNVSHVSTLLCLLLSTQWAAASGHGTLVRAWFCFYQRWSGSRQLCGGAASYLSVGPRIWGPLGWIRRDGVKDDSIGLCPP